MNVEVTTQLTQPFAHAADSNPGDSSRSHGELLVQGYALSVILYLHTKQVVRGVNPNLSCGTFRMTMNVGQAFLDGPEDRGLRLTRKPSKILWENQRKFYLAALRKSLNVPAKCGGESRLVKQRGMEQVRNRTHLLAEFLYQSRAVFDGVCSRSEAFDVRS